MKRLIPAVVLLAGVIAAPAALRFNEESPPGSRAPDTTDAPPPAAAPVPPIPDRVDTFKPSFKATIAGGVSRETLDQVRAIPGVGAAARVLLSSIPIEPQGGMSELSIAAVEPDEFRQLTPDATAQAKFVWEGLHQSKAFIANEEYQILGGKPILALHAQLPQGRRTIRIGGVATNGVPSLAGAMMELNQATELGLGAPTLLLIGTTGDANIATLTQELSSALPGVSFQNMLPPSNRTFYSGTAAQKAIGTFTFTANPDGTIRQNTKWVNQNLASARMPIIGAVRCHKLMLPQLRFALEEIQSAGLAHLLKPEQAGRCYQPRYVAKDPTHQLSKHAWGLAIDLNVYDNPEGSKPRMDPRIVAIFERWGFRWGGRWTIPDGMHFELAALLKE